MRSVVYEKYGPPDVLEVREVDKPIAHDDEVRVRVRAVSLNPYDWHFMTGLPYIARPSFGLLKPKAHVLGADLAGHVDAVGKNVTGFAPGDEVFGEVETGSLAEYVCVSKDLLVTKPADVTFEQAAAVPLAALTALQALRDVGNVQSGQRLLVNGASGGVGTFAVQIAKSFGAEVTGVCSGKNVDMVRSIGADHTIDYTDDDFTRRERHYDLILDLVGNRSLSECRRALRSKGVYVSCFGQPEHLWFGPTLVLLRMAVLSPFVSHRLTTFVMSPNAEDLRFMRDLLEAGKVTPIIARTYPLGEVADAFRFLEEGHVPGKVVIRV